MKLCPSFNKALLPTSQRSSDRFDTINALHCGIVVIIGMKVWSVVLPTSLHVHPNDDSKESGQLRHLSYDPSVAVD
jgi:hypothetical protein